MKIKRLKTRCFRVVCSSERSSFEDDADNGGSDTSFFGCFVLLRKIQRVDFCADNIEFLNPNSIVVYGV